MIKKTLKAKALSIGITIGLACSPSWADWFSSCNDAVMLCCGQDRNMDWRCMGITGGQTGAFNCTALTRDIEAMNAACTKLGGERKGLYEGSNPIADIQKSHKNIPIAGYQSCMDGAVTASWHGVKYQACKENYLVCEQTGKSDKMKNKMILSYEVGGHEHCLTAAETRIPAREACKESGGVVWGGDMGDDYPTLQSVLEDHRGELMSSKPVKYDVFSQDHFNTSRANLYAKGMEEIDRPYDFVPMMPNMGMGGMGMGGMGMGGMYENNSNNMGTSYGGDLPVNTGGNGAIADTLPPDALTEL